MVLEVVYSALVCGEVGGKEGEGEDKEGGRGVFVWD